MGFLLRAAKLSLLIADRSTGGKLPDSSKLGAPEDLAVFSISLSGVKREGGASGFCARIIEAIKGLVLEVLTGVVTGETWRGPKEGALIL